MKFVCGVELKADGQDHAELLVKEVRPYEIDRLICYDKATISGPALITIIVFSLLSLLCGYIAADIKHMSK